MAKELSLEELIDYISLLQNETTDLDLNVNNLQKAIKSEFNLDVSTEALKRYHAWLTKQEEMDT